LSLRRRLVLFSAPVMLVALLAAVKMISVVVAGNSAVTNFSDRDTEALGRDTSTLNALNVVEPAKAPFAAGTLAVLQGRLDEADEHFSEALSRTDAEQSCPVLVNLELVRERRGDIDGWEGRPDQARERYRDALAIVRDAPDGCFENNNDPDAERRAVRSDSAARLAAKLAGVDNAPLPPPPAPPPAPPPPPPAPPPAAGATDPEGQPGELRLNPGTGDPTDKLRQILQDAAG
jgi:tetratricopeptide (TPR) repeat protein